MSSASTTPATPDAKSTTPSSAANGNSAAPAFTPKEENLLKIAMVHCLKSGPPEIDSEKFMKYGEFNTMKTAQNTWGKIKGKLNAQVPKAEGEAGGEVGDATPKTPNSKTKATPKKRGKKADADADVEDAEGDADGSPKKKRKSPVKKTKAKKEEVEDGKVEEDGMGVKMEDGE